jgi:CBS domain containing-hemolysin-like protein
VSILLVVVPVLIVLGSVLAMSEAAITSSSRARALALVEQGRRNAETLERITTDPPRYLNAIYLSVMFVQNGSAILVAIIAEHLFGGIWVTVVSFVFTLAYFVVVEAMSKTFAILHGDRVALFVAPIVDAVARVVGIPVRLLIGLSNVLLPGRGLKQGPFVSEDDIRAMAELGHEEGTIAELERKMIHSAMDFGHTETHEVMTPRPEVVAVERQTCVRDVANVAKTEGHLRLPVYDAEQDNVVGVVHVLDLVHDLASAPDRPVADLMRDPHFVPESKKVSELFREMQRDKFHLAIVVDEHGDVAGLVTMDDLLGQLVGEIADEYDTDEQDIAVVGPDRWRVSGTTRIGELSEFFDVELPEDDWDTAAGLMTGLLGRLPSPGDEVRHDGLVFRAERVGDRRVDSILVRRDERAG